MLLYTMKVSMKPLMPSRWRRLVIVVLPKVLLQSCLAKALLRKRCFGRGDVGEVTEDGCGAPHAEELGEGDAYIDADAACRRPEKS